MKRFEAVISSTQVDKHGDIMARSALESMERIFEEKYLPIGVEHDPRHPPIGRFTDAWIEDQPDGISILKGIGELFEPGDLGDENPTKTIVERRYGDDGLEIIYDRSYENEDDLNDIRSIAEKLGTKAGYEAKKAVEPLSIIAFGATFALGAIASGFIGGIGADAYEWTKKKIKGLLERQKTRSKEQLLVFSFTVTYNGVEVLVQTILTNPSDHDIDTFWDKAIYDLDEIPKFHFDPEARLSRVVYFFEDGQLTFKYAVRNDGFPVTYHVMTEQGGGGKGE